MLLLAVASLGLLVLGLAAVAKVAHLTVRRLGLEPLTVLLFFGLAEAPAEELSRRPGSRLAGAPPHLRAVQ